MKNASTWSRLITAVLLIALFATACGSADDSVDVAELATEPRAGIDTSAAPPVSSAAAKDAGSDDVGTDDVAMDDVAMEPVAAAVMEDAASEAFESSDDDSVDGAADVGDSSRLTGGAERAEPLAASSPETDAADEARADTAAVEMTADAMTSVELAEPAATPAPRDDETADVVEIAPPEEPPAPRPRAGLLTAGDVDDNLNYEFFGNWISQVQQRQDARVPGANLNGRIRIDVTNNAIVGVGVGIGNLPLTVSDGETTVTLHTSSSGVAWLYPHHVGLANETPLSVEVRDHNGDVLAESSIDDEIRNGDRALNISVDVQNQLPDALDIALVLDVTGSMSDELAYLTEELQAIIASVEDDYRQVDVAVSLIVYRDVGEDYVTRVFDFADVDEIRAALAQQSASGGGDFPEAMHTALEAALQELSWRDGNVARMLVLNADAPPHREFLNHTIDLGRDLTEAGIRIYPLAASGVDETAEFTMRVIAATSGGRHLFLTDDSGIGNGHSEPKAECYQVTALSDLLRRVIASELAGERIEANQAAIVRTVGQVENGRCV